MLLQLFDDALDIVKGIAACKNKPMKDWACANPILNAISNSAGLAASLAHAKVDCKKGGQTKMDGPACGVAIGNVAYDVIMKPNSLSAAWKACGLIHHKCCALKIWEVIEDFMAAFADTFVALPACGIQHTQCAGDITMVSRAVVSIATNAASAKKHCDKNLGGPCDP